MMKADLALWKLVRATVAGDPDRVSRLLAVSPSLARACFQAGATRQQSKTYYLEQIGRYVVQGDTALHIAAAAYETEIVRALIAAGADVHARNRRRRPAFACRRRRAPSLYARTKTVQHPCFSLSTTLAGAAPACPRQRRSNKKS
jgi:ankyrin repeat protein